MGQLLIHLFCMVYIANLAKEIMGEEGVREVIEFEKELLFSDPALRKPES